ncbi:MULTISPECIES: hypothetical protein [Microbacterium]|uniref:hypothetical protein n=1 Tax=Microbacterium TaxID=33882 RepID=UPI0004691B78|nr:MULTISPECIES: hypothetical protein [Microbacterium]AMG84209.1 hypothetical protein AXH82_12995 [Microbacterium sp. PAMC 28756]QXE31103.1 hypothetical protein IZR02_06335 [Microbacterium paraoxydans]
MSEIEDLRARLRALEQENEALRRPRRRISARSIIAGIVLVVAVLLAPIAAMGTWARLQLVDADRFVATFAPLAEDPDVQDFVADQVTAAIDEQVDLDAVVGELFDGLRALDLPPRAAAALGLLEAPAASGLSSLIDGVVHEVVSSQQFADIWAETLRFTHERAVAILQDEPGTALDLSDDVLSVDVGAVVERVKEALAERGAGVADLIPVIDRTIPVVQADALVLVRTVYQIAVTAGFWLPWVVLGLVVLGVLLAVNRPRALFWTSAGFAVVFLLLAAGMGIGRGFFVSAVSPSIMTASAAESLFDQLTALLGSTIVALALVGVLIALWAWLAGSSRSARTVRGVTESGFGALRETAEARGLSTGRFGRAVDRYRGAILIAGMAIGVLILLATRPVTFGAVLGVAIGVLVLTILVELLRRPGPATAPEGQDAAVGADASDAEITRGG